MVARAHVSFRRAQKPVLFLNRRLTFLFLNNIFETAKLPL